MGEIVDVPVHGGQLSVIVSGQSTADYVLLHPSLGRWAHDFDHLVGELVVAGFSTIAFDPRGVGRSTASSDGVDMRRLADDVVDVLQALGVGRAHLVGHAFGNRVVRTVAALRRELVASATLLGAGGRVPGDDEARAALTRCFDATLPATDRLAAIAVAFFAPGNDPSVWTDGWFDDAYRTQGVAAQGAPIDGWWDAGGAPLLVVQGLQDRVAPPANGRALAEQRRDHTELVEIDGAGHALLPERPDEVAAAVVDFLRRHRHQEFRER